MINPIIEHYSTGELFSERWFVNDRLHRTDGPAIIHYYPTGEVKFADWFLNGRFHRVCGPAEVSYSICGKTQYISWWIYGKAIEPYDWLQENGYKWPLNKQQQIELLLRFA